MGQAVSQKKDPNSVEDALDFMYSENQAAFEAPASKAWSARALDRSRLYCATVCCATGSSPAEDCGYSPNQQPF